MADRAGHTHDSFGQMLGALGPGGTATLDFDDYRRLFGADPTEDELESQRAAGGFAAKHDCDHRVDHASRRVHFIKRK